MTKILLFLSQNPMVKVVKVVKVDSQKYLNGEYLFTLY